MSVSFITFFVCDFYVALLWHCEKNWNVWLAWKCSDNIKKIVRTVNDVKEGSPKKHKSVVGSPHHFLCSNGSTMGASWTFLMWHHWRSSLYTYISKYYNLENFRKLLQNCRKNHYQNNFSQPFLFFSVPMCTTAQKANHWFYVLLINPIWE